MKTQKFRHFALLIMLIAVMPSGSALAGEIELSGLICGKDLTGDGDVDGEGELLACVNGVCPHDTAICTATYTDPHCPDGGTLDTTLNVCYLPTSSVNCPSGYSYSSSFERCEGDISCPSGYTYDDHSKYCEKATYYPATLVGNGTATTTWTEDYGAYTDTATLRVDYDQVRLETSRTGYDVVPCYRASEWFPLTDMPEGGWGGSWGLMCNDPKIDFDPDALTLTVNLTTQSWTAGTLQLEYVCPDGGELSGSLCIVTDLAYPSCTSGGTIDLANDICYVAASYDCQSGYSYVDSRDRCEAFVECLEGSYNAGKNACYLGDYECPYSNVGSGCADMDGDGVNKCSPFICIDADDPNNFEYDFTDSSYYQDDGEIDPDTGECLGEIIIFNGKPSECRRSGVETLFTNCCNVDATFDTLPFIELDVCNEEDVITSAARSAKVTHSIGTYCKTKIDVIGCIQKARVFCKFNSVLARIINQQGREQLQNKPWGSPKNPRCKGFTPEEFQMLDFSLIDLGEFIDEITPTTTEIAKDQAMESLQGFQQQ